LVAIVKDSTREQHVGEYRPDIDGLRAVAVTIVILFHAGLGFPGGFIGVDVFFVISGFLITRLITSEVERGVFTFSGFWARRIGRIVPAATAMILGVLAVGILLLLPEDLVDVAACAVAQQCMAANVYLWKTTGYFAGPAEMNPLLHTWSLAVEEQFYILYPLLLGLFGRVRANTRLLGLAAVTAASFALGVYGTSHWPSAAFYLLPTRAWEISLGGIVYLVAKTRGKTAHGDPLSGPFPAGRVWQRTECDPRRSSSRLPRTEPSDDSSLARRPILEAAGFLALATIVLCSWLYDASTPFPGWAAVVPCLAAATLIHVNGIGSTVVGRILASKPFVSVGLASYSLYLWHWPVLAFLRYWSPDVPSVAQRLAAVGLGGVLAVASWKLIENPIRRLARTSSARRCFVAAIIAVSAVVGVGLVIQRSGGLPNRLPASARLMLKPPTYRVSAGGSVDAWERGNLTRIGGLSKTGHVDFVVWGDSHAGLTADTFDELAAEKQLQGVVASRPGTPPIPGTFNLFTPQGDQRRSSRAVEGFIRDNRVGHVFLVAKWQNYVRDRSRYGLVSDDEESALHGRSARKVLLHGLDRLCRSLDEQGVHVWIVLRVPHQSIDPRKRMAVAAMFGGDIPMGIPKQEWTHHDGSLNDDIRALAARFPRVQVIDPSPDCFAADGLSKIGDATGCYYRDAGHVTPLGARMLLRPSLVSAFEAIAADRPATGSTP